MDRHKLAMIFKDEEKCPFCNNIIEINARDEIQADRLLRTIRGYIEEELAQVRKMHFFRSMRGLFWSTFLLLVWFYSISFFVKNVSVSLWILVETYGLVYITSTIIYFLYHKTQRKKQLRNEIKVLTEGVHNENR